MPKSHRTDTALILALAAGAPRSPPRQQPPASVAAFPAAIASIAAAWPAESVVFCGKDLVRNNVPV